MPRVPTDLSVGKIRVATENRHLMGPSEGAWWQKYSWWVIPLGFLLLMWPGWLHQGIRWLTSPPAASPPATITTPSPTVVPPPPVYVTVTAPPSPPAPAPAPPKVSPPADPTASMTAEEKRDYEVYVLRRP